MQRQNKPRPSPPIRLSGDDQPGMGLFWLGLAALGVVCVLLAVHFLAPRQANAQNYDYRTTPLLDLTNSAQTAKAGPGTILYVSCVNPNATAVFLQIYDTTGAVTVGTTAPTRSIQIPPLSATGQVQPSPTGGLYATAGIKAAITTTATGGTAPATAVPCDIAHR